MKILFVNQYYAPDLAPTARVLTDLTKYLVREGHEVTVICSKASYRGTERYSSNEIFEGVNVRRLSSSGFSMNTRVGAILNYMSFHVCLCCVLLRLDIKPDLVMAMSSPPFAGLSVRMSARIRGWRYGHWVMNIFPSRLLRSLEALQFKGSSLVLTICKEMADNLELLGVSPVKWVPLWANKGIESSSKASRDKLRAERGWGKEDLVIMYSGNMGLPHRFDEIEEVVRRTTSKKNIRWVFFGDGKRRNQLERMEAFNAQFEIHNYVSDAELGVHLGCADIQLVSLGARWQGCAVPCKIHDVMMAGCSVIFIGPVESSAAGWIKESGCGWLVSEGGAGVLMMAIEEAADRDKLAEMSIKARDYARNYFDVDKACEEICSLMR